MASESDLIDIGVVAFLIGYHVNTVNGWPENYSNFPKPAKTIQARKGCVRNLYRRADIVAFLGWYKKMKAGVVPHQLDLGMAQRFISKGFL